MDTLSNTTDAVVLHESDDHGDGAMSTGSFNDPELKRMGSILPEGDDFTVNNKVARRGLWPDSPIRKTQGMAGSNQLHYAVEIQDADGEWHLASRPGSLLSPQYLLVTNDEIREMAEAVARRTGYDFRPTREYFDGSRYERFYASPDLVGYTDRERGDAIELGLRAVNTYDGSARARVEMYLLRLACVNGMLVKDGLFSFRFEHKISSNGGRSDWEVELDKAGYELRHLGTRFDKYIGQLRALREVPVGHDEMRDFTRRLPSAFPATVYGALVRRFYAAEDPTAFGLLNACTWATFGGGAPNPSQADFARNEDFMGLFLGDRSIYLN